MCSLWGLLHARLEQPQAANGDFEFIQLKTCLSLTHASSPAVLDPVVKASLAAAPRGVKHARQGNSCHIREASSARAPAHAARMAPTRVPSRMGQATTVASLSARPARGSSTAVIPQTSRSPSHHLTRNTAPLSPSTNALQQAVRHEGNWQGSREAP